MQHRYPPRLVFQPDRVLLVLGEVRVVDGCHLAGFGLPSEPLKRKNITWTEFDAVESGQSKFQAAVRTRAWRHYSPWTRKIITQSLIKAWSRCFLVILSVKWTNFFWNDRKKLGEFGHSPFSSHKKYPKTKQMTHLSNFGQKPETSQRIKKAWCSSKENSAEGTCSLSAVTPCSPWRNDCTSFSNTKKRFRNRMRLRRKNSNTSASSSKTSRRSFGKFCPSHNIERRLGFSPTTAVSLTVSSPYWSYTHLSFTKIKKQLSPSFFFVIN